MRRSAVLTSVIHCFSVFTPFFFASLRFAMKEPTTMIGLAAAMSSMIGRWNKIAIVTPSTTGMIAESQGIGDWSGSSGLSPGSMTTG